MKKNFTADYLNCFLTLLNNARINAFLELARIEAIKSNQIPRASHLSGVTCLQGLAIVSQFKEVKKKTFRFLQRILRS